MAIPPPFCVLVRDYYLPETNSLVQSPNVDPRAHGPQIIVRDIDGEYAGEPRILNTATSLSGNHNGKVYRHAAHGVCVSSESHAEHFPIWVCLQRTERRRDQHIWVLSLSNLQFSVVPISQICWVPSHQAANGDLHTVLSSPGKHGYQKEMRLPTIVQKLGFPDRGGFSLPLSSLLGFTRLKPERREALFNAQYRKMVGRRLTVSPWNVQVSKRIPRRRHIGVDRNRGFPSFWDDAFSSSDEESICLSLQERTGRMQDQIPEGFCRCKCDYSDLGPTYLNPYPLHTHIAPDKCTLGSSHAEHCVFASHRPNHCVVSVSRENHEHCVTYDKCSEIAETSSAHVERWAIDAVAVANATVPVEIETKSNDADDVDFDSLSDELEPLTGGLTFYRSGKVLEDEEMLASSTFEPCLASRPESPVLEFLPDTKEDMERLDNLPDPTLDVAVVWETRWKRCHLFMTPELPEMCR